MKSVLGEHRLARLDRLLQFWVRLGVQVRFFKGSLLAI